MKKTALLIATIAVTFCFGFSFNTIVTGRADTYNETILAEEEEEPLKLGAFSISLNVKDLAASKQFYENLGFSASGGNIEHKYLIMKNENTLIGLFQGFFEGSMLTFNPGWDANAGNIEEFDDVREIQKRLKSKGITLTMMADETTTGPAYIMTSDPDGNVILIDQHR